MQFEVLQENSGQRLDSFLAEEFADVSRSQWQKKIKAGEVLVNDKAVGASYKVKAEDRVKFLISPPITKAENSRTLLGDPAKRDNSQFLNNNKILKLNNKKKSNAEYLKEIEIIFKNDDYVVVNKPAGMLVHPDKLNKEKTLVDWLIKKYPAIKEVGEDNQRPGIVHRLDKDVSGLLVIALNNEMFKFLKEQFKHRQIDKEYLVLVHNRMRQASGEIKTPIKRSKRKGIFIACSTADEAAKKAITQYEVIEKFVNFTLLKVKILTGRTHQIRVHLSSIGHPVVGDKLYATHDIRIKKKIVDLGRLWLQAVKLGFRNLAGERVEYKIEPAAELVEFLKRLK